MKNSVNSKNNLSLDNICELVSIKITKDDIGNSIKDKSFREIFCCEHPVYASEFYNATQQGIKAKYVLLIDYDEYEGEQYVKYDEGIYSVYKTYKRGDGLIELYCEDNVGGLDE